MKTLFNIRNEISPLKKVLTHSPDGGIGKVIPSKAQDWLYEDIVDLNLMQEEYDSFKKILLAFLDPAVLIEWQTLEKNKHRDFKKPSHKNYLISSHVLEIEHLLGLLLKDTSVRSKLVSAVCATEKKSFRVQSYLEDNRYLPPEKLSKLLISGGLSYSELPSYPEKLSTQHHFKFIFTPIPNLIFTRDLGVMIGDHLLLTQLGSKSRRRESLLMRYLAYFNLFREESEKIIEISEDESIFLMEGEEAKKYEISLEGGDMMMIHSGHLLIGCSERTSSSAIRKIIHTLFKKKDLNLHRISVILIPRRRSSMHIDTLFTQVRKNTWVMHTPLSRASLAAQKYSYFDGLLQYDDFLEKTPVRIVQFANDLEEDGEYRIALQMSDLETLLIQISVEDFKCHPSEVEFIYSGNSEFPYAEREQWTDSCNVVALKEGVVIGYDRNYKTIEAFQQKKFSVLSAKEFLSQAENCKSPSAVSKLTSEITNTLITLPCSELSRARGGTHCMTMPLLRE